MDRRVKINKIEKENIRRRYKYENITYKKLAEEYNVSLQTIAYICNENGREKLRDYMKRKWDKFPSNSKENQKQKRLKYLERKNKENEQ